METKFEPFQTNFALSFRFVLESGLLILATSDLNYMHEQVFLNHNFQFFIGAKIKLNDVHYMVQSIRTFTGYRPPEQYQTLLPMAGKNYPFSQVIVVLVTPAETNKSFKAKNKAVPAENVRRVTFTIAVKNNNSTIERSESWYPRRQSCGLPVIAGKSSSLSPLCARMGPTSI